MPSEGVSGVYPGEQAAFALERIAEQEVFRDRDIDFQFFLDIDAEAPADVDNEPIPPHVAFNTEAHHSSDVLAFVPDFVFTLRIINTFARGIIISPVMFLLLIPEEIPAHPEESAVKRDIDAEADLSVSVFHARSLDIVSAHRRNELAVDGVKGEKRTRIA